MRPLDVAPYPPPASDVIEDLLDGALVPTALIVIAAFVITMIIMAVLRRRGR